MFNSTREFEATVLVRGKPVTEVVHNGKTFIEGRKKSTYELYFRNNSSQRVLVVPSVDGLSAIDGQPAGKESPGYVIEPWSDVTVPGWTVNGREAAEFVFHAQGAYYADEETYVEQMGEDPRNQGAIGFMVFRERPILRVKPYHNPRVDWPRSRPIRKAFTPDHTAMPDPFGRTFHGGQVVGSTTGEAVSNTTHTVCVSSSAAVYSCSVDSLGNEPSADVVWSGADVDEGKSLGTGFGEAVEFETQQVEFQREADPCAVFAFFYDTIKNLRRAGVPVEQFARHYSQSYDTGPDPFPNSPEVAGYANAPRGWTGRSRRRRKTRS